MNREQIHAALIEEGFETQRRDCTPRVMAKVDVLLDQLLEINLLESMIEPVHEMQS